MSMRASFSWTRSAGRASRRKTERRWPQVGPERGTGAGCGYDLKPIRDLRLSDADSVNPCESTRPQRQRRRGLSAASFVNRGAGGASRLHLSTVRTSIRGYPSTLLSSVLLTPIELELEKLDPLDLLPLLELLDDEPDTEMLGPVVPPEFEMPGPEFEIPGPGLDDPF